MLHVRHVRYTQDRGRGGPNLALSVIYPRYCWLRAPLGACFPPGAGRARHPCTEGGQHSGTRRGSGSRRGRRSGPAAEPRAGANGRDDPGPSGAAILPGELRGRFVPRGEGELPVTSSLYPARTRSTASELPRPSTASSTAPSSMPAAAARPARLRWQQPPPRLALTSCPAHPSRDTTWRVATLRSPWKSPGLAGSALALLAGGSARGPSIGCLPARPAGRKRTTPPGMPSEEALRCSAGSGAAGQDGCCGPLGSLGGVRRGGQASGTSPWVRDPRGHGRREGCPLLAQWHKAYPDIGPPR